MADGWSREGGVCHRGQPELRRATMACRSDTTRRKIRTTRSNPAGPANPSGPPNLSIIFDPTEVTRRSIDLARWTDKVTSMLLAYLRTPPDEPTLGAHPIQPFP